MESTSTGRGLPPVEGADDSGALHLVHDFPGTVVSYGVMALQGKMWTRCSISLSVALLPRKEGRVPVWILVLKSLPPFRFPPQVRATSIGSHGIRLSAHIVADGLHFRSVDKCALHAHHFRVIEDEHVAASDELLSSRGIENGLGVDS